MAGTLIGLPGISSQRTVTPRRVFLKGDAQYAPTSAVISGAASRDPGNANIGNLRAGLLMGKITSGGKYAPSVLGVTSNNEAVGATSIQASAAVVTELVRRQGATGTFFLTGNSIANGTVVTELVTYSAASSVNITCTAIANAFLAGAFIQPTDGSQNPKTFIAKADGVDVLDLDGASMDNEFAQFPIGGTVDYSQLLPAAPTDLALFSWIVARLNDPTGGRFVFDTLL